MFSTAKERNDQRRARNAVRAQRRKELEDMVDVSKMTEDEKKEFEYSGKYGYVRTKNCKTCKGEGEGPYGDQCDDCMCGGCGAEKYFCGGCSYDPDFVVSSDEEMETENEEE